MAKYFQTEIVRQSWISKYSWGKKLTNHPVYKNSYDGILLIDSKQTICFANPSFQALYGVADPTLLIGRSFLDVFSAKDRKTVFSMLELFGFMKQPTQPIEVEIYNHDNHLIPVCVWFAGATNNGNQMTFLYVRDISDWKKSQSYLTRAYLELGDAYRDTLEGWGRALELRDHETEGHTRRVTEGTVQLALKLNISVESIVNIRYGAMLHDIGKMAIPDTILLKPGPLDSTEWQIMRMHPVYAKDMLSEINFLKSAITIPFYHHEKWDGTGYPMGLQGEKIPIEARIFTVIDVWDALLSDRPYRKGWHKDKVFQYIDDNKSVQFDPEIVDVFLGMQQ
jgi:PAS domain S-box-containing protein